MPIGIRLDPEHVVAPAGADVDGSVVLSNRGPEPVHVRLVLSGEVAGWGSIEPADFWIASGADVACELRFRLPRGAPGGIGAVPFIVRVLSDQEGEGGAIAEGTLDVTGEAELALRLLPATFKGVGSGTTRVAVDNLGSMPARAQLIVEFPDSASVTVEPDSVIVEPNSTAFAKVHVRPRRRLVKGTPRAHEFWLRVDPLGGARISASGTMLQRSLVAGYLPRVATGFVGAVVAIVLLSHLLGGDSGQELQSSAPLTTVAPTTTAAVVETTTTAAPAPVAPGAPPPTIPLKDRRIAFQSKRDGNYEIYTANADGKDPKNITLHPGHDGEPTWSPDHTRIAFDSDRTGNFDVYIMNADGSGVVQLTTEPAPDGYPTWSPDGTRLAFTSFRDGNSELYVMNVDGTGAVRMTKNFSDDSKPVWSPDGKRIAFQSDRDGNYEIYVMNADGTDQKNLTNTPAADKHPAWSPNGARLAFDTTRDGSKAEIYVMGADGGLPVRVSNNDDLDSWPVWSPDGRQLVYQSDQDSDPELYVIGAGGGAFRRITESPGEEAEPSWG